MRIYTKIGTHPAMWRRIYRRSAPEAGDVFKLRPYRWSRKPERVRCTDVSDLGDTKLYFVERA